MIARTNEASISPIQANAASAKKNRETFDTDENSLLVKPNTLDAPKSANQPVKKSIRLKADLKFVAGRREMDQHLMLAASKHTASTKKNATTVAGIEEEALFTWTLWLRGKAAAVAAVSVFLSNYSIRASFGGCQTSGLLDGSKSCAP